MWDVSCNGESVAYHNGMTRATVVNGGHYRCIRGPFWHSGRHIVNVKIVNKIKDGFSIGIVDKSFDISSNTYIGSKNNSYTYYYHGYLYGNGSKSATQLKGFNTGDIVTIDVDLDKGTLNWAINGNYLTQKDAFIQIPKQAALACNMHYAKDSIQIIQYYRM